MGETVENFGTPYDDDDSEIPAHQKEKVFKRLESLFWKTYSRKFRSDISTDKRLASVRVQPIAMYKS